MEASRVDLCSELVSEATSGWKFLSNLGRPQLCGPLRALWLLFQHKGDGGCPGCLDEALQVQ